MGKTGREKAADHKNKGFTLIELIIVVALLVITVAAVYTFFSFTYTGFTRADRQTELMQYMNQAVTMIGDDIRSASRPNTETYPVVVQEASGMLAKGQRIDIYKHGYKSDGSSKYIRVCYRLDPSDKTVLQRGEVVYGGSTPPSGANPEYETITAWKNILTGVIHSSDSGIAIGIFEDTTAEAQGDRRKIQLNLSTNSISNPLPKPVEVNMTITSRSKGVPE